MARTATYNCEGKHTNNHTHMYTHWLASARAHTHARAQYRYRYVSVICERHLPKITPHSWEKVNRKLMRARVHKHTHMHRDTHTHAHTLTYKRKHTHQHTHIWNTCTEIETATEKEKEKKKEKEKETDTGVLTHTRCRGSILTFSYISCPRFPRLNYLWLSSQFSFVSCHCSIHVMIHLFNHPDISYITPTHV